MIGLVSGVGFPSVESRLRVGQCLGTVLKGWGAKSEPFDLGGSLSPPFQAARGAIRTGKAVPPFRGSKAWRVEKRDGGLPDRKKVLPCDHGKKCGGTAAHASQRTGEAE